MLIGWAVAIVWVARQAPPIVARLATTGRFTVVGVEVTRSEAYLVPWLVGMVVGGITAVLVIRQRGGLGVRTLVGAVVFGLAFTVGGRLQYRLEAVGLVDAVRMTPGEAFEAGGMRLPLGYLLGAVAALAWCRLVGAPWRASGDGMAVWASVMSALGRVGCLLAGCCMGAVCHPGPGRLCLRYPPATPVYLNQVAMGLLVPGSPASHPAHVLPAYFALVAVAMLALLLGLLRLGAPPGSLLATFGILEPLGKLALESLRAVPRRGALMVAVPLATLGLTLVVMTILRRRQPSPPPAGARSAAATQFGTH